MKIFYIFLIAVLLQTHFNLHAQDSSVKKTITKTSKDTIQFNETVAYKMLYENQVKSNDAILKTIYYALGALGTAIILVIGGNWWFNTKKVEDLSKGIESRIDNSKETALAEVKEGLSNLSSEKTNEINQIQIKLQEEVTANMTNLTQRFSDFSDRIKEEVKEDIRLSFLQFDELVKIYTENLSTQIKSIETLTNERSETLNLKTSSLETNLTEKINTIKENLEVRENKLTKNIKNTQKSLQAAIHRTTAYMWESRKIFMNALLFFVREGEINLELNNTSMLNLSLENISSLLEDDITEINDKYYYDQLIQFLDKLPTEQFEKGAKLKEIANRIYKLK
jgi:hypothetical protein